MPYKRKIPRLSFWQTLIIIIHFSIWVNVITKHNTTAIWIVHIFHLIAIQPGRYTMSSRFFSFFKRRRISIVCFIDIAYLDTIKVSCNIESQAHFVLSRVCVNRRRVLQPEKNQSRINELIQVQNIFIKDKKQQFLNFMIFSLWPCL